MDEPQNVTAAYHYLVGAVTELARQMRDPAYSADVVDFSSRLRDVVERSARYGNIASVIQPSPALQQKLTIQQCWDAGAPEEHRG